MTEASDRWRPGTVTRAASQMAVITAVPPSASTGSIMELFDANMKLSSLDPIR